MYEHIDMKKTGILLKYRIEKAVQYMEWGSDLSLNEIFIARNTSLSGTDDGRKTLMHSDYQEEKDGY